jgi:tetratricopeptide (TPR) repeat protein
MKPGPVSRTVMAAAAFVCILATVTAADEATPGREAATPGSTEAAAGSAELAGGDALWAQRGASLSGRLAAPAAIEAAIESYRAALSAAPGALEPRWKLLRALHYSIDFADRDEDARQASVNEAVALAHDSTQLLESGRGSTRDRARLYFWSSIAWGTRASRVGLLTIVREGLATKMHDFAGLAAALDPSVDEGGALRLLSRLHATVPRVPFISGWVERDQALPLAERALALEPAHPGNQLIMALTLLEQAPGRRAEARAFLERAAAHEPRAAYRAEDLAIGEQARERLEELDRDSQ